MTARHAALPGGRVPRVGDARRAQCRVHLGWTAYSPRNERSQAAIARLGATREGVLRGHQPRADGTWRDTVVFSVLADEWPGVRARLEERLTPG